MLSALHTICFITQIQNCFIFLSWKHWGLKEMCVHMYTARIIYVFFYLNGNKNADESTLRHTDLDQSSNLYKFLDNNNDLDSI